MITSKLYVGPGRVFTVFAGRIMRPVIFWKFLGVLPAISPARIGTGAETASAVQGRGGASRGQEAGGRGRELRAGATKKQKSLPKPAQNSAPKPYTTSINPKTLHP